MEYNSLDAMLMGGIVPNAITPAEVDRYLATNTRRKKKVQYGGQKFSANNWKAVLLGIISQGEYNQLVEILTHYLRTAANYSISGGPRAVEAMGHVRNMIGSATQPIPQLIVRIIRDMRTLRPSIKKVRRQMFIDEPNPVKALGYMQFIPSVGIYRDTIQALPSAYAKKMLRYASDRGLRTRAAARALIKARNITGDPNYVPELMGTAPLSNQQFLATHVLAPQIRQSMRWTKGRNPNATTDPAVLARLARGRRTASDNLARMMAQVGNMPGIFGAYADATPAEAVDALRVRSAYAARAVAQASQAARAAAAQAAQAAQAAAAAAAASVPQSPAYVPQSPAYVPPSPAYVPPSPAYPPGVSTLSHLRNPYDELKDD